MEGLFTCAYLCKCVMQRSLSSHIKHRIDRHRVLLSHAELCCHSTRCLLGIFIARYWRGRLVFRSQAILLQPFEQIKLLSLQSFDYLSSAPVHKRKVFLNAKADPVFTVVGNQLLAISGCFLVGRELAKVSFSFAFAFFSFLYCGNRIYLFTLILILFQTAGRWLLIRILHGRLVFLHT